MALTIGARGTIQRTVRGVVWGASNLLDTRTPQERWEDPNCWADRLRLFDELEVAFQSLPPGDVTPEDVVEAWRRSSQPSLF